MLSLIRDFLFKNFEFWILCWIALGLITFLYLIYSKTRAPYGRHVKKKRGILIDNSFGWFIMEMPALIIMPILSLQNLNNSFAVFIACLWLLHYFNRTIVFPLRINTKKKKIPISIVLSAFAFNSINGLFNGYHVQLNVSQTNFFEFNIIVGVLIFFIGMLINITSDNKLISLRRQKMGYKIPQGKLFKLVSCPNYLGEIIEWFGFFIIVPSIASLSFFLWTSFNLIPRALNHHEWYKEKFKNYPKNRKAVIPFIL